MDPAQGGGEGRVQQGGALIKGVHVPVLVLVSDRGEHERLVEVETGLVLPHLVGHLIMSSC